MKTSSIGIDLIKSWEKFRPTAYKDVGGVWTIGYGHTAGVKEGDCITMDQAVIELQVTVTTVIEPVLNYCITTPISQNQFDALVDLSYNIGTAAFAHSTLLRLLNSKDPEAPTHILEWNKVKGKVIDGLVNRRKEEYELFNKDPWPYIQAV